MFGKGVSPSEGLVTVRTLPTRPGFFMGSQVTFQVVVTDKLHVAFSTLVPSFQILVLNCYHSTRRLSVLAKDDDRR